MLPTKFSFHEQRKWFHVSQLRYYHGIDPNSEVVPIPENISEEASSEEEVEHTQTQRGRGSETHTWKLNVTKDRSGMVNAVDGTKQFGRGRGNGSFTAERGRGNMKVCTYCGKTGHIIDNCYKKHGYPPNLGRGSSYANQVEVYDSDNKPAVTSTGDNGSMSLIREKYKNLMVLLDKTHDLSTFPREINLTLLALMQIVV
ncbi:hypothetical protein KIW84_073030 [Lathyrus oleraceus]|uniref:CCHC-type domain-containing protein n=1 Tax=Pisum sativum TaxID=3888 RepID=A0A9D4ZWR9_PEA|nr:hypothetical protein KIW84_073030 [Pisum sativum]